MSDNLRRYRAIKQELKQLYPKEPQGNLARHLDTLAGLIICSTRTSASRCRFNPPDSPDQKCTVVKN